MWCIFLCYFVSGIHFQNAQYRSLLLSEFNETWMINPDHSAVMKKKCICNKKRTKISISLCQLFSAPSVYFYFLNSEHVKNPRKCKSRQRICVQHIFNLESHTWIIVDRNVKICAIENFLCVRKITFKCIKYIYRFKNYNVATNLIKVHCQHSCVKSHSYYQ